MKIITLCECGLGTCYLLKFTVEKVLSELGISAEVVPIGGADSLPMADLYVMPFGLNPELRLRGKSNFIIVHNVVDADEMKRHLQDCIWLK